MESWTTPARVFDTDSYVKQRLCDLLDDTFTLDNLHAVFSKGGLRGISLLDIGTGPCMCSVISASPYFDRIYLSDIASGHREDLWKWLTKQPDAYNWDPIFQYVENLSEQTQERSHAAIEFQKSVRRKVAGILYCDVTQTNPLYPSVFPPFDVIVSSLCLDGTADDLIHYRKLAGNIANLLRPGGCLVLVGVLGESFYTVGSERLHCLSVTPDDIQMTWKSLGFEVLDWKEAVPDFHGEKSANELSDNKGCFVTVLHKANSL